MNLIRTAHKIIKMDAQTHWELNHGESYEETQMKRAVAYLFVTIIGCAFGTAIMFIITQTK
jgi:hypothetical protein